jgi:hypothetical protein
VLYEDRIVKRISDLRIVGELDGSSMGGYVHSKRAVLPRASLGSTELDRTVFLVKAPSGNILPGIDGYLGTAALKARRLDFDLDKGTLAWKR